VRRAIDYAIRLGYLLPESRQLCLVVSSDHVQGGKGNADAPCPRDHTIRARTNDGSHRGRFGSNDGSEGGRSGMNDGNGCGRSTLRPSLSSTDSTPDDLEVPA
jgi:hypothetical protein